MTTILRQLTPAQKTARRVFITDAAKRNPVDYGRDIREGVAAFNAAGRPAGVKKARKAVKKNRKARKAYASREAREERIKRRVTEALTAAQAPQPAPGATAVAARTAPPGTSPRDMTADQLAAAAVAGVGGASPFWRESAPARASAVAESATPAGNGKPLHELSGDEFTAASREAFSAYGRAGGFGSPSWAS